jgi:hypothetical protein
VGQPSLFSATLQLFPPFDSRQSGVSAGSRFNQLVGLDPIAKSRRFGQCLHHVYHESPSPGCNPESAAGKIQTRLMNTPHTSALSPVPARLRRLKSNERVQRGDFVQDESQGFKPWEGLSGFRADAFVNQIYRWRKPPPAGAKKQS